MINEDKNKMINAFDEMIHHKLYDLEIEPSKALWANIEEAVQTGEPIQKNKDRSRYFLLLLAFVSLIGISGTSSFYILNSSSTNKQATTNKGNANMFALAYNQVNGLSSTIPFKNSNYSSKNYHSNTSNDKFNVSHVVVNSDNTKHIYLETIAQEKLDLSKLAEVNRISNYKDVPVLYMNELALANMPANFNNLTHEADPIFINNRPNVKGLYFGAQAQSGANMMTKNNTQNKMLGSNIIYAPNIYNKAGVIVGYNITNSVGVQSGMNYIRENISYTSSMYDAATGGKLKLSYVELPIIVKYRSNWVGPKNKTNAVNIYSGLSYSYLVRAEAKFNNEKLFKYNNRNYNAKDYLPNHNLNFIAGIEYQIYLKNNLAISVGAEAKYGGSAKELSNWTQKNTSAFTNVGVGVNTTITFSTKKQVK